MAATDTAARLGRLTARTAPVICTTTILAAARAWNVSGAEHSFGAAFLMGAFAAGAGAAGFVSACNPHGDPAITAIGFGGAATFAMAGVAAYSDPLPLPILLWLIATIAAYAMAARYWRDDRRAELAHYRAMERDRAKHRHGERVEEIRGRTAEKVAETTRDAAYAAQLLAAHQHRQMLDDNPYLAGLGIAADIALSGNDAKQPSEK